MSRCIPLAASDTHVDLRVTTTFSCATRASCKLCDGLTSQSLADACYATGCACFGTTVTTPAACAGMSKDYHRAAYACPQLSAPLVLPGGALVTMSVYDFDTVRARAPVRLFGG